MGAAVGKGQALDWRKRKKAKKPAFAAVLFCGIPMDLRLGERKTTAKTTDDAAAATAAAACAA